MAVGVAGEAPVAEPAVAVEEEQPAEVEAGAEVEEEEAEEAAAGVEVEEAVEGPEAAEGAEAVAEGPTNKSETWIEAAGARLRFAEELRGHGCRPRRRCQAGHRR